MNSVGVCSECGTAIPADSPGGFCSRCLLGLGLIQMQSAECGVRSEEGKDQKAEVGGQRSEEAKSPLVTAALTEKPGDRIGRYRLLEEIGHGGCGVVYMAEQEEPVRRRVALKVIKLGMDTKEVVARFEAERQALALMDHPNIAKVLDAGATEMGRPYFVMELVGGIKITDYCDQNQITTRERLDLFIQVCRAIQHAHQKGVIHRDIKPSNVLVATHDGVAVPKVIDFGIAKATQGRLTDQTLFTAFEQFIGTPAYMSPEQAQMGGLDIDTRSDIYSLGVLLYELLTGTTPFDTKELVSSGLDEMRRVIREVEPVKPSTRLTQERLAKGPSDSAKSAVRNPQSAIDRDLDWIVMKCLEKDRNRRYETTNGLARDLERYLNQEPVLARPPSAIYRLHKFIRRNRMTAAAATAIATMLVLGVAVSTWQAASARRAGREQSRLRGEAEAARLEMRESLRSSLLSEARALRVSGQPGRRFQSLAALSNAAAIRPSVELRNEAIAAMTQVDIQLARTWQIPLGQEQWWWDNSLETFTVWDPSGNLRVRSALDNRELARIKAPDGASDAPGVFPPSQNGRFAAVGYPQGKVHVWDISRSVWSFSVTGSWAELSPDNKTLAVVAPGGGVAFYDLANSNKLRTIGLPTQFAWIIFESTGRKLAAVIARQTGHEIQVFDVATGEGLAHLSAPAPGKLWNLAWHPDGRRLAFTLYNTNTIAIWDTTSEGPIQWIVGPESPGVQLDFSPDGKLLAAGGWDGKIRLFDVLTWEPLLSIAGGWFVRFSPNGRRLGCAADGIAGCYDVAPARELTAFRDERQRPVGADQLTFNSTGTVLAHQSANHIRLCEPFTGKELAVLSTQSWLLPDPKSSDFLLVRDGRLCRLPVRLGRSGANLEIGPLESVDVTNELLCALAFSADGHWCMLQAKDDSLFRINASTWTERVPLKEVHAGARWLSLSPDGRWLASGAWHNPTVYIYDASTGEAVKQLTLEGMSSVAFSPDGRWLVIGGKDFKFLAVGTWEVQRQLERPPAEVFPPAMTFSRDGKILAVAHSWRTIRLINPHTGEELAMLEAPKPWRISWLSFNADASLLAVASEKGSECHLWNLRLIRQQLASMNLDWDMPPYPLEDPALVNRPFRIIFHTNAPVEPTPVGEH